jgi:hypothetical protein
MLFFYIVRSSFRVHVDTVRCLRNRLVGAELGTKVTASRISPGFSSADYAQVIARLGATPSEVKIDMRGVRRLITFGGGLELNLQIFGDLSVFHVNTTLSFGDNIDSYTASYSEKVYRVAYRVANMFQGAIQ